MCDFFSFLAVIGLTDIFRPDMAVKCLADRVQLDIFMNNPELNKYRNSQQYISVYNLMYKYMHLLYI